MAPSPFPSMLNSWQESSRARQCCWLVTVQHLVTMQCCGSSGAQFQGWTHACTAGHHMDHNWGQGRTHLLQPQSPHKLSGSGHPLILTPSTPPKAHWAEPRPYLGEQQEGQQSPTTCEELPSAWPGCPHAYLGMTQSVLRAPGLTCQELCCHRGAALATVRSVLDHRSCSGLITPISDLQTVGRFFTSSHREAPQRTLNSTQRTCAAFAEP